MEFKHFLNQFTKGASRHEEDTQKTNQIKPNQEITIFLFHPVCCTCMVADFIQLKQDQPAS